MKSRIIFILLVLTMLVVNAFSQVDTISMASRDLVTANLRPGWSQYLVYMENPRTKKVAGHSLWNRKVAFKTVGKETFIEITQHWSSSDTTFNRYVYSLSRKEDFSPVYHYTKSSFQGIEAFNFTSKSITGADTVSGNKKATFSVPLQFPTFNWELDLEVFSTLPFKKVGQQFIVSFYHPGGSMPPAYYKYSVIDESKLPMVTGGAEDCWELRIDYNEKSHAIFWISKKSKEVLKMREEYMGRYRYKVRLATSTIE